MTARYRNIGNEDCEAGVVRLGYDSTMLRLHPPGSEERELRSIRAGGLDTAEVQWVVELLPQMTAAETELEPVATAPNHVAYDLRKRLHLAALAPEIDCTLEFSATGYIDSTDSYAPMPRGVTFRVMNTSEVPSDTLFGVIRFHDVLSFAAGADTLKRVRFDPPVVADRRSSTVTWKLTHDLVPRSRWYPVEAAVVTTAGDTAAVCLKNITIPGALKELHVEIREGTLVELCEGDTMVLHATPGFAEYSWSTGDTTPSITVTEAGRFYVEVHDEFDRSATSMTTEVILLRKPPKPNITRSINTLRTDAAAAAWQWYRNGVPITGAEQYSHAVTETGSYRVMITAENGCTALSDVFDVHVLSVENAGTMATDIRIVPADAEGRFTLHLTAPRPVTLRVAVRDLLGRVVVTHPTVRINGSTVRQIDLSAAAAGIYLVQIRTEHLRTLRKIIKR